MVAKLKMKTEMQRLFGHWHAAPILSIEIPTSGTINDVRIVATDTDRYVLRIYRHNDTERVELEHAVVHWLAEQGFPAVAPLPKPDGATYHLDDGRLVTLLPCAQGVQVARSELGPAEIAAMGCCLGELHGIMRHCPVEGIPVAKFALNRDETLAEIDRFLDRIEALKEKSESDENALCRLATRRDWLLSRGCDEVEIDPRAAQLLHGDYQESNVFFARGQISAVIDWDKIYKASAAWEVIRTLDIMLRFSADTSRVFLDGYRQKQDLSIVELDRAAHLYGLMRAYDLWLFREIYDRGNERMRQFVYPGEFVPIEEQFLALRPHIA